MSTVVKIGGKSYIEPGAYAFTKYNPTSVNNVSNFGNVLIIDTVGYGLNLNNAIELTGGSGIDGELNKGIKSVYEFTDIQSFRKFTGGGKLTNLVRKVFDPMSDTNLEGTPGAPKVYYVRAATTVAAKCVIPAATGVAAGAITLVCKNEGISGNTYLSSVLKAGYLAQVENTSSTSRRLKISKGTFEGQDSNGEPYGQYSLVDSTPEVVFYSEEYTTVGQLYEALLKDSNISSHFVISVPQSFDRALLVGVSGTYDFEDGASSYTGQLDNVFEAITELDYNFVLSLEVADSVNNSAILTHLRTNAKFQAVMFCAQEDSEVASAVTDSEYYNNEQVVQTIGSPIVPKKITSGNKTLDPVYLTASVLGLVAGAAPQTPLTFKRVGYSNFLKDYTKKEREQLLQGGVMHVRNISGYWCVNQGITTVQDNLNTVALDGQTRELSIVNIKAQINKELILEGEKRFVGNTIAQSSPESIKNFTETKLASFIATPGNDNLIMSWKNVKVTVANGDSTVTYDFVPNVPLNKVFFIGNMLDFKF